MNYLPKKISKNYYKLLSSAFHIPEEDNDKDQEKAEDNINATHKIDWILDVMKEKFKKFYEIGNKVTIDEAMIPSKSRQEMKFYTPMKPIKFGFKLHCLCDSETNYLYDYIFDPGKKDNDEIIFDANFSFTQNIVLRLVEQFRGRKLQIFHDGWHWRKIAVASFARGVFLNKIIRRIDKIRILRNYFI